MATGHGPLSFRTHNAVPSPMTGPTVTVSSEHMILAGVQVVAAQIPLLAGVDSLACEWLSGVTDVPSTRDAPMAPSSHFVGEGHATPARGSCSY